MLKTLFILFLAWFFVGCTKEKYDEKRSTFHPENKEFFYVTNRSFDSQVGKFNNTRGDNLSYGDVKIGIVEKRGFHLLFNELQTTKFSTMMTKINNTSGDVVLFIHGFNVSFEESLATLAHLQFDFKKTKFVPIVFSWASQGSLEKYSADESNVLYSMEYLRKFLIHFHNKLRNKNIHIIAHSMGNKLLLLTLKELAIMHPKNKFYFKNIVLVAPDIDSGVFYKDIYRYLPRISEKTSVYLSSADKALKASKIVHSYPRLGADIRDNCRVSSSKQFQLIDVSSLDTSLLSMVFLNHSDYLTKQHYSEDIESTLFDTAPTHRTLNKIGNCEYYQLH